MNKIIFTSDRLFMSVVGPGGSWKTRLIFSMLPSEIRENLLFLQEISAFVQRNIRKTGFRVCLLSQYPNDPTTRELSPCL